MAKTDEQKIEDFQKYMTDEYFKWAKEVGLRDANESKFATEFLKVSAASFNAWIRGLRVPNYENAIIMSFAVGPEIFDVLEYPPVVALDDPDLRMIFTIWTDRLPGDIKNAVLELINNYKESQNEVGKDSAKEPALRLEGSGERA